MLSCGGGVGPSPLVAKAPPASVEFAESRIPKTKACTTCHTIGSAGGTVGPRLNQIGNRRDSEWLRKWLRDPNAVKEGTRMPNFQFSDADIEEAVGYLGRMKQEVPSKAILTDSSSPAEAGEKLFRAYDCFACHRIGREGRFAGPDLTWLARRKTTEWEKVWLRNPPAYKPGTFMPNFHLDATEIDALAAFLHTLDGQSNADSRKWEEFTALVLDSPARERGALVFKRLACWSCHGENGAGGVRNANAVPTQEVPPLTNAANDYGEEELRDIILNGKRPEKLDPNGPDPYVCPPWNDALTDTETGYLLTYLRGIAPRRPKFRFR